MKPEQNNNIYLLITAVVILFPAIIYGFNILFFPQLFSGF